MILPSSDEQMSTEEEDNRVVRTAMDLGAGAPLVAALKITTHHQRNAGKEAYRYIGDVENISVSSEGCH